jgi:hypothetical protein
MQGPSTHFLLGKLNGRHHKNQDIMHRHGDRGGDLVTSTYPRDDDGKKRFQTPKRCESEKNSDGGAERDRVRRVRHRHQRHVVIGQPLFFTSQEIWQTRSGSALFN